MIRSFYQIGRHLKGTKKFREYFLPWANPFPTLSGEARGKIVIAEIGANGLFKELSTQPFKSEEIDKYLYRPIVGSNGTNLVPTLRIAFDKNQEKHKVNIGKTLTKVQQSLKNYKHLFLKEGELEKIETNLIQQQSEANTSYLLTFKIDGKWFGDFPEYKDLFYREAYDRYSKDSKGKNQVCSVSYESSSEVWGRIDTLGFTVDAVTFCRNGFNQADSYKMFPVSPEAAKILEGAKRIVFENLTNSFYGLYYFVLPRFLNPNQEVVEDLMRTFLESKDKINDGSLGGQTASIINDEQYVQNIISDEVADSGEIYFDIFFYQKNQSQLLIRLHVSDVLPSRFREIMECKAAVEKRYQSILRFTVDEGKKTEKLVDSHILISRLRHYFAKEVKKPRPGFIYRPTFFKIIEAIFYGSPLREQVILDAFVERIRQDFVRGEGKGMRFYQTTKETWAFWCFFSQLGLFRQQSLKNSSNMAQPVSLTFEGFKEQHQDFFDNPVREGAFLLGRLTRLLMLAQYRDSKSGEPFRKYLNGMNIDLSRMHFIYNKLEDKLYHYRNKFRIEEHDEIETLKPRISDCLAITKTALTKTALTKTEISFAFAAGMAIQSEFSKQEKAERDRIAAEKAAKEASQKAAQQPSNLTDTNF